MILQPKPPGAAWHSPSTSYAYDVGIAAGMDRSAMVAPAT